MLNDYSFLTYIVGFLGLVVLAIGVVIVFKGRDFLNRYLDKIRILTILFLLLLISNYFLNYMNKQLKRICTFMKWKRCSYKDFEV